MVYIFLADGFEEVEALTQIDLLRRADIDIMSVGVGDYCIKGAHGIEVKCDTVISELEILNADMLILPGGMPGVENLYNSEKLRELIVAEADAGTMIAAICAAPLILGRLGLANCVNMICYPGFESELSGAAISAKNVVRDKNYITAKAAGSAIDFAYEIISALKNEDVANKIVNGIYYER